MVNYGKSFLMVIEENEICSPILLEKYNNGFCWTHECLAVLGLIKKLHCMSGTLAMTTNVMPLLLNLQPLHGWLYWETTFPM